MFILENNVMTCHTAVNGIMVGDISLRKPVESSFFCGEDNRSMVTNGGFGEYGGFVEFLHSLVGCHAFSILKCFHRN